MIESMNMATKKGKIVGFLLLAVMLLTSGCTDAEPVQNSPSAEPTQTIMPTVSATISVTTETKDIVDPNQTYSYEQMLADAQSLAAQYPDLISTDVIGYSVEGRELLLDLGLAREKQRLCLRAHTMRASTSPPPSSWKR